MEKTKAFLLGCCLFGYGITDLCAQPKSIRVIGTDKSVVEYPLTQVKKITFPVTGRMRIGLSDGTSEEFNLSDLARLNITTSTNLGILHTSASSGLSLYPNPMTGSILNIDYQVNAAGKVEIELLNIMGMVVMHSSSYSLAGQGTTSLNIEGLESGAYVCRISTGDYVETKKIIKN